MIIYLSGAITKLPHQEALRQFSYAAKYIRDLGHTPVNPMELDHDHDQSWVEFMKVDIVALLDCEGIYMLDGWQDSKGAAGEHAFATAIGLKVFYAATEVR